MLNVFEVADSLMNHIKSKYPNDVAIIAYYGSYAQGTATERSDLDFFFIPASADGYRHSLQFIVKDISFDFWPISWERAERMAAFDELNVSIIADCKLLYVRSEEDLIRFMALREQILTASSIGMDFIYKAEAQLRDAYIHLCTISRPHNGNQRTLYRYGGREFLAHILNSVALLNRTYFSKGWGKNTKQISEFVYKPDQLETLMQVIMQSDSGTEIREACDLLFRNTVCLLAQQKEQYIDGPKYMDRMKGFYEEVKGISDKILTACERNDYPSAYFWGIGLQSEIARALFYTEKGYWPASYDSALDYMEIYAKLGFPDLAALLNPEQLQPLFEAVQRLDVLLEQHLKKNGVVIHRFIHTDEFKHYLNSMHEE